MFIVQGVIEVTTYGYARVSTKKQVAGNSLQDQAAQLQKEGCDIITQEQYTGAKMYRPKLDEIMGKLQPGDKLIVTKLDRLGRNVIECIQIVKKLFDTGVKVHVLNMGLVEDTPTGRLIFNILSSFAEFERDLIIERTQAGKEIARARPGFKDGRPNKYTKPQLDHALDLLRDHSYNEVERITRISKSTLIRHKRRKTQPRELS